MRIDFEGGKYTYIHDAGRQVILRHGSPWKEPTGDKFLYLAMSEIEHGRKVQALFDQWFEQTFAQACSNGLFDAWGRPIDCKPLNEIRELQLQEK